MQRHRILPFLLATAALAGCGNDVGLPTREISHRDFLRNPLYAEYYYDDLTETMLTFALTEDPMLEDADVRAAVDRARVDGLERAKAAVESQRGGSDGPFLSDRELVVGEALLLDRVLYLGPTFDSAPGPSLRLFLTSVVDPRDAAFPDDTAVDLGEPVHHYGAQAFAVPRSVTDEEYAKLRTVVLWDDELGIVYGFAQLQAVTE